VSSSVILDTTPLRRASRLFLYGLHVGPDDKARSAAAIGLLGSASFDIAHMYRPGMFDMWYRVCGASRGGIHWLLFLDWDGRAATGTIDHDFAFVLAKSYPKKSHLPWKTAAVDGNGELLLTIPSSTTAGVTKIAFGQVDPDGTFIVWWQSEIALAQPDQLRGLPHAHAWLTTTAGAQPTSTVWLLRRGAVVGSRTWNERWTGMAVQGDLLVLYRAGEQVDRPEVVQFVPPPYEVCRVGADHRITTLMTYGGYPPTIDVEARGADIDTPTGILFYQFVTGSNIAEVRSLTERGFVRTAALGQLQQVLPDHLNTGYGWFSIAPC
jgi:hypothetical protein